LPASDFLGATVTVPIPFSRLYRGDLDAAYAGRRQAEALSRGTAIRVEGEVREAFARYEAAAARVRLYATGVLADADQVLEKTLYNYQRGGATLVEVLVAQRTDNDVYLSYYDSLADAAHALIAVERAAGIWDVAF
jgi:cobalt-zinc-cadmium efflux system outer membrane protein